MASRRNDDWFENRFRVNAITGCWIWAGATLKSGYGVCLNDAGKNVGAHTYSYQKYVGFIPPGMEIDHKCERRNCVNPAHLICVSGLENKETRLAKNQNSGKTHCNKGHAFTSENTFTDKRGHRTCKTCNAANARRYNEQRRREHAENPARRTGGKSA